MMKVISLWQPWASAMAIGAKMIETRSWRTHYRGPLLIHAAARRNVNELIFYNSLARWLNAMAPFGFTTMVGERSFHTDLPFGAIIAVGNLIDVKPTGDFTQFELDEPRRWTASSNSWTERDMGDFSLNRFGWIFSEIVALPKPIPAKGHQGFWHYHGQDFSHLLTQS